MKYAAVFIILFSVAACGSSPAEKSTPKNKVEAANETTETIAKPVLVDHKEVVEAPLPTPKKEVVKEEKVKSTPKKKEKKAPKSKTTAKADKVAKTQAPASSVETTVKEVVETPTKEVVETVKEVMEKPVEIAKPKAVITPPALKKVEQPKQAAFSHAAWNTLAQKHISSTGKVNYKGFKADIAAFDAYLASLAKNPVQSSWSRAEKMAYWINAYNAFTIKLIVDNYPTSSITKLHGGKPWDVKWIKLGSKTYSLNNIEHDILRPQFKDARIHFAVNCAAKSCPPVLNKAWTAKNLESNLERSAKQFINNAKYNTISGNSVAISKIFEWYAEDFGDMITYLNKYANTKIKSGAKITYKNYEWALNE